MVWFSVCGALLGDSANGGYVDVSVTSVVSLHIVLVLWGSGLILGNGYGILEQNCVVLLQESEISAGLHSRNLIGT